MSHSDLNQWFDKFVKFGQHYLSCLLPVHWRAVNYSILMKNIQKDDLPNSRLRFDIEWAGQIKILAQKYKMKRRPILAASTLYDFTTSTESLVLPYVVLICSLICSEKFPNNPLICFNLTFGEDRPDSCTTLIAPPCSIFYQSRASELLVVANRGHWCLLLPCLILFKPGFLVLWLNRWILTTNRLGGFIHCCPECWRRILCDSLSLMWCYESDGPFWKSSTCLYLYWKANYETSNGHVIRFPYGWHQQTSLEQKEEASAGLKHKEINKSTATSWSQAYTRGCQGYKLSMSEEKEPFNFSDAASSGKSAETSSNTFILPFQSLLRHPFPVNIHYKCEEAICDTFLSLRSKEAFLQSNLSSLQATSYAALQPSSFSLQPSFSYS